MKQLSILFVLAPGITRAWMRTVAKRVTKRLSATMGYEIVPTFATYAKKVPFASFEPENGLPRKWVPDFWMRENIGPLTKGEDLAMLCLPLKAWPKNDESIVKGKIEYSPLNGKTYLSHILADKAVKVQRGSTWYALAEDSLFHEILHLFEDKAKRYGIVHASINNLEAAALALRSLLEAPGAPVSPPKEPEASPATLSLFQALQARLAALLAPKPPVSLLPPSGLGELIARFGDPRLPDFEKQNIVSIPFPSPMTYVGQEVRTGRCHKLMVPVFASVFQEILDAGLAKDFKSYGGIFSNRLQTGGSTLSVHAFGAAIDVAPELYPRGSKKRMPQALVDIFLRHGFVHGRGFPVVDEMHFQWATDY